MSRFRLSVTTWYSSSGNLAADGAIQSRSSTATTIKNAPSSVSTNPLTLRIVPLQGHRRQANQACCTS